FFFSSRRRHTRSKRDWSSDVCSSDLLVTVDRRSRAYGLYYTLSVGASSSAPTVCGLLGDAVGVGPTLVVVALVVLVTIPLCLAQIGRASCRERREGGGCCSAGRGRRV